MVGSLMRAAAAGAVALLAGCGSPMIHPAATSETSLRDDGLVGEWRASAPVEIRAVISEGSGALQAPEGSYYVLLTVYDRHEFKTALGVEVLITQIEGTRFADVFLAKPDRDRLVGSHGFLAIPVHQVFRLSREKDELTVWPFVGKFPDSHAPGSPVAHEAAIVGSGQVPLVTGSVQSIRAMLGRVGKDEAAFDKPVVFSRMRRAS